MLRLKESRKTPFFNGALECRLFRFDMVAGFNRREAAKPKLSTRAQAEKACCPTRTRQSAQRSRHPGPAAGPSRTRSRC
jgi:hypothetical protein